MNTIYPASPQKVSPNLSKPRKSYQQRALLAMAGLSLFVALYLILTFWFIGTAYRLFTTPNVTFEQIIIAFFASFLGVFMIKPLFKVRHYSQSDSIEITAKQEPQLFDFIYCLADEAKAPRPHKVFLSSRVNAAVFYDVSILNLFFNSKKNLEIGLGLVNVLTLSEFKAVLAHEFGHFAQRSMAVGRWVYIAQQIAAYIVAERDILDKFLRILSRIDIRLAWIGWILSLIVWSIRSLLETVFNWLLLAQRALSREMEFQADLVAVSLTGSDALIHALHRIHAADEGWDRTLSFASSEIQQGRTVKDLFVIQTRIIEKVGMILNDAEYGKVPVLPTQKPESHRLFKSAIAEPPRMWATHPSNVDRENNAKRIYIANSFDERSAWILFTNSQQTKEQMTGQLIDKAFGEHKAKSVELADSIEQLEKQYQKIYFDPAYRGNYLGRSIVSDVAIPEELYDVSSHNQNLEQRLATLYPESLTEDLEQLKILQQEQISLKAIQERRVEPVGGVIKHRGKAISRLELPSAINSVEQELKAVKQRISYHDSLCRTTYRQIAARIGNGWEEYIVGLLKILHYADHAEADLRDVQGYLGNVLRIITADRNISRKELKRLLVAATELDQVLAVIYSQSGQVYLDSNIASYFNGSTWSEVLGKLNLAAPNAQNINQWIKVIDSWINLTASRLSALRTAALEQLLLSERALADAYLQSQTLPQAPNPSQTPEKYAVLIPGQERKRQTRLGWWDRFQTADGMAAQVLRLLVALAIMAIVPWAVATLGS